jgi:hypothetical protein
MLLSEVTDREVRIADDQSDLSLVRFSPHPSAEPTELLEVPCVLDLAWRRIARLLLRAS